MKKYALGVDYGTLSMRAVLVDVATGEEAATKICRYTHGVIDSVLPDTNIKLTEGTALQHPQDWLECLGIIKELLKEHSVSPDDVVGVGIDFTACTVLPVDKDLTPLCLLDEFKNEPHAYPKLWKHHASSKEANRLNEVARARGEAFLPRYGGAISPEWAIPKIWQILNEAPNIYETMDKFIEGADWLVAQLTGAVKRNSCTAGYKGIWHKREGFPSQSFFKALDPRLEHVIKQKFDEDIYPLGTRAGGISKEVASITGLNEGTAVAVGNIDAHAALPAVGVTKPGQYLMIMGTSTCNMLLSEDEVMVEGMCGVVEDGIIPGFYGYESGQSCVGDHFQWFVETCVSSEYYDEAAEKGVSIHQLLSDKADDFRVGESGLIALDWWNGNRSTLVDMDLTGLVMGMTLSTKPEAIYRALIEATAYGAYYIVKAFQDSGVPVNEVFACGGIAQKNKLLMQIYADVFNMPIKVTSSEQTVAVGSAMFGAVAAGTAAGGYGTIAEAAECMAATRYTTYTPIPENVAVYKRLFDEYKKLYAYFGKENHVMKTLKEMKRVEF